jgi:hypothetical protein
MYENGLPVSFPLGCKVRSITADDEGWLIVVGYDTLYAKPYVLCRREDGGYLFGGDDVDGTLYEGFCPSDLRRV